MIDQVAVPPTYLISINAGVCALVGPCAREGLATSMGPLSSRRGQTLLDIAVVITLLAAVMSMAGPLSRRVIARYQLNAAAQTLAADLSRARMSAIRANAITPVKRVSERYYRADQYPRELPRMVQFAEASTDSLAFNGLGATQDGRSHRFVLVNTLSDVLEVQVYAGGGLEVVRP